MVGKRSYRLSPAAEVDLEGIWLYTLRNWSQEQADSYHRDLVRVFEGLSAGAIRGRPVALRSGYLKYAVSAHVIYFRADGSRIEIMRILHSRMDADRHLKPARPPQGK